MNPPILPTDQVARVAAMNAIELDDWMVKALGPGTPLWVHRDTTPDLQLRRLVEGEPKFQVPMRESCRRLVARICQGELSLPDELAEDLLHLAHEWEVGGLVPLLLQTIEAKPRHPQRQRQLMLNLLVQGADLSKDFWLSCFTRDGGELVVGAFRGLLKLDPKHALSLLHTIPAVDLRAASITIFVEFFFRDHPEHSELVDVVREQVPRCSPDLAGFLTEWLNERSS